ncbi:AAA family ATPase [Peribacillus simplex]|uniref:ATP-dependent nuclease n=1 Tax=Peribacillus simplex TaxID=1478 RepID=UPI002989E888|nr:AAA family ATPase [Peribacillus simplex]MBX9955154.1 AAA family ATPase [Peribacillus simplex]
MRVSELRLSNFKSFGEELELVSFDELTAIIGANSTGKTSLITSLLRLFGQKNSERNLVKSDFHISPYVNPKDITEINLFIEAKIDFPELIDNKIEDISTIPNFMKQIIIDGPSEPPYIRIRLIGKWIQGQNPEGNIEQEIFYVTVPFGEDEENALHPIPLHHRNLIQMIYVPAMRDPAIQLKNASGALLWRIFNNISWPERFKEDIKDTTEPVIHLFNEVADIKEIQKVLNVEWNKYHRESRFHKAEIVFNSNDLDTILKNIEVAFSPNEDGAVTNVNGLGDGLKSLFYITLVSSLLEIEKNIEEENKPLLNILAVEEPENHISPHLLGRVVNNLNNLSKKLNAQVILSSHNSSIIKRVDPEKIRHIQINDGYSMVHKIKLPEKTSEAHTYIKEAIKAYPDLYFSKLVILGEGDSEEIVIPKILSAFNIYPDETSISIVPLGGRHVNHMWKLLNQLSIPHITLLDLDRERNGGGWGRIKYALNQLNENGRVSDDLLHVIRNGDLYVYTIEEIQDFHKRNDNNKQSMDTWIKKLEKEDVFFSYPLDIDFSMLISFESEYKSTMPKGPQIPEKDSDEYIEKLESSIKATLKSEKAKGETYSTTEHELMIWYNSLFLGRGKPSTHIEALLEVESEEILSKAPEDLLRMAGRIEELIK